MTCPGPEDSRLSAWLDGELSEREHREIGAHVQACRACGELVDALRSVSAALTLEVEQVEPDPGFVVRFRERRDELSIAPWWTWRQLALRLVPLALGVLGLACLTVALSSPAGPDPGVIELEALGASSSFEPGSAIPEEPVLSIALGTFAEEEP